MSSLPLIFDKGHLLLPRPNGLWVLDTGAPTSFGFLQSLEIAGQQFACPARFMGLDAGILGRHIGLEVSGLIGTDVLDQFDIVFSLKAGEVLFSKDAIEMQGTELQMEAFMGVPIIPALMGGQEQRMFFDTGAALCYWQGSDLSSFPPKGTVTDFYPGFGEFEVETHLVPLDLMGRATTVVCGALPGMLGNTLGLAGVDGILGNAIMMDAQVGYFPRRQKLVLA